ncbi:unnamed protein product [Lota lota]
MGIRSPRPHASRPAKLAMPALTSSSTSGLERRRILWRIAHGFRPVTAIKHQPARGCTTAQCNVAGSTAVLPAVALHHEGGCFACAVLSATPRRGVVNTPYPGALFNEG